MRNSFLMIGVLMLLYRITAADAVYQCEIDGHPHFQGTPCPGNAKSEALHLPSSKGSTLIGCYRQEGKDDAIWRVASGGKTGYRLTAEGAGQKVELPVKVATSEELAMLSKAFAEEFKEGLSMVWPKDTPNTKPVGVFRVAGRDGRERVVAYFFIDGGYLEAVKCP